jgi:hypothetical protein
VTLTSTQNQLGLFLGCAACGTFLHFMFIALKCRLFLHKVMSLALNFNADLSDDLQGFMEMLTKNVNCT